MRFYLSKAFACFGLVLLMTLFAMPASSTYDLIYDAADGSLTIDTNDKVMGGYVLEFDTSSSVFVGPFLPTDPPANLVNAPVNVNQVPMYAPGIANRIGY